MSNLQPVANAAWGGRAVDGSRPEPEPETPPARGVSLSDFASILTLILGTVAGHPFPEGPTFGLPCPTTIATFGILLWATRRVPGWLLVIPAVWSIIGTGAAVRFGVPEDYGLLVAGVVGTVLVLLKNRKVERAKVLTPSVATA